MATTPLVNEARHLQRQFAVLWDRLQAARLRHADLCTSLQARLGRDATGPRSTAAGFPIYGFAATGDGGRRMVRRPAFAGGSDNGGPRYTGSSIRVLVAGGHLLTRRAIVSVLEHEGGIQPVGEADTEADALGKAARLHADIIVIMNADADGRIAINLMTARHPVKVLMLRDGAPPRVAASFVHPSGPNVPADITPMTIGDAVRAMHTGRLRPWVDTRLMGGAARPNGSAGPAGVRPGSGDLTERERDVLAAVAQGFSDKEIAARLFLSESTVKTHLKNLYRRFNLRNRAHAAVFACERGVPTH